MAELFHVNQEFTVYQDFLDVISQYQQITGYSLTTYDCRTMNTHCASRKKIPNIYPDFPFYYAYYHCPRSGTYVPKKNDDAKQRNIGTMKTGCPVILQGTVNLQRKVFRITKWISSHNHLAVEGKDTKTVDSNTQIKLVKKNQNVIQRTEVVENKQMDDSVTEGFYVINNEGDLLKDNQLIHQWPIKNIFTELERNIRLDITSTAQIKTNMLRELLRKFFIIDEDKKKQAADISPVRSTEQRSSPGVILNQILQQEESLAINLPSCSSWQKFDHHVIPAEESEEEEVLPQKMLTFSSSNPPVVPAEESEEEEVLTQKILTSPSSNPPDVPAEESEEEEVLPQKMLTSSSNPPVLPAEESEEEEVLPQKMLTSSSNPPVVPAEESEEEEVLTQKILTSFSSDHPVIPAEVLQDGEVLPQGDLPSQSPPQLSDQLISLPSFTPLSVQQEASNGLSQPLTFIQPSSNNNSEPDVQNFKNIIVDNVIPRGRPKRSKRPAIGEEYLSFPSKLLKSNRNDDLINFLNHLIPESKIKSVVNKDTLVTLDDMKNKINPVSDAVPGGFLKVKRIKNYFDAAAYQCLINKIKEKNDDTQSWSCNECLQKINDELQDSIECEKCWFWYHFTCGGITCKPKATIKWFCPHCLNKS